MSFEHKVSNSVSSKSKLCQWWKLATLVGASVNRAEPTTKGFKVRNGNYLTMWIKNRIFVVFSFMYRQNHGPTVECDYSRHPQNSSSITRNFITLVWSWTDTMDLKFLHQSGVSKKAKDRTFHWSCWHTKPERKERPKEVKDKKLQKGEIIGRHSGPVTVLNWCDKINATMVSTYHNADTQRVSNRGKETEKLLCVIDYNHRVGESIWRTSCCTCTCSRGKKWPNGISNFSKGYWSLQFSIRLLFIDKWRKEIYSCCRSEFG